MENSVEFPNFNEFSSTVTGKPHIWVSDESETAGSDHVLNLIF